MLIYCWTLVPSDTTQIPHLLGVTSDREHAQLVAEKHLRAGDAFVALIEAVRPALTAHGMDSCYLRVGLSWLGRMTRADGVLWTERSSCAVRNPEIRRP